jgi:glucose-6-phosphate isomerase
MAQFYTQESFVNQNLPDVWGGGVKFAVERIMGRLEQEDFKNRMEAVYGKSFEQASSSDPKFAKIGFDGGKNRMGWTLSNLKWLVDRHPDKVYEVLSEADEIRKKGIKNVIFCGMGGSGLSVQAVKTTFGVRDVRVYSLRTTDPATIDDILKDISKGEKGATEDE